jgi:hypothetical protein
MIHDGVLPSHLYTINITDNSYDNLLKCISKIDYSNMLLNQ